MLIILILITVCYFAVKVMLFHLFKTHKFLVDLTNLFINKFY